MSVIISEDKTWIANNWVSFKLFRDCLKFVDENTEMGKDLKFLEDVSMDTFDLTDFEASDYPVFDDLINQVIDYNQKTKGTDMADPSYFKVYLNKILELKEMLIIKD